MTGKTPLWRQVNPHFVREGRVTSQAFRPSRKDRNRLSVDNGDLVSPGDAFRRFTQRYESAGVLAVLVAECNDQGLDVVPDPLRGRPAHAVIDFRGMSASAVRRVAERLRAAAVHRGWRYRPKSDS